MNFLDLSFLLIFSVFFLRGLFRGFVIELTSLVGLILGYLIAITYMHVLSTFLMKYFPAIPHAATNIVSFTILFIVTNIVLRFIASAVTRTLRFALLGWLNRLLGGIAGLIKSILLLSIVVFLISFIPFSETYLEKAGLDGSYIFPLLKSLGPKLYQQILNLGSKV